MMTEVQISEFWNYRKLLWMTSKSMSLRKVTFGEQGVVEFNFESDEVIFLDQSGATTIAKLVTKNKSMTSILGYSGCIIGDKFTLTFEEKCFSSAMGAVLNPKDYPIEEYYYSSYASNPNVPFGGRLQFNYNGHLENACTIAYLPQYENFAKVVGAIMYLIYQARYNSAHSP